MINWPQPLIAEIAQRRCIPFIGAGFSHFSEGLNKAKPPLWGDFLGRLKDMMHTPAQKPLVDDLIAKERYLDAAEIIRDDMIESEYNAFLQEELRNPCFRPARVHEYLRDLDLNVVLTTNYDTIYEDCCRAGQAANLYATKTYHDHGMMDDLRSTRRLIVKAHGCATVQSRTILTRSSYFKARQEFPAFFAILDALFTTNTLLFMGYGLGDPDIQMVLENVALKAPTSCPHYIVSEEGKHPALKEAMRRSYNLHFLEHGANQFVELETALGNLVGLVSTYRNNHP